MRRETKAERNAEIRRRFGSGESAARLAGQYGLSLARVRRIVEGPPAYRRRSAAAAAWEESWRCPVCGELYPRALRACGCGACLAHRGVVVPLERACRVGGGR